MFYQIVLETFRFKRTITIFTFNFMNFFWEIINKIWLRTCHKSSTGNKFYFVRYSDNTFITIFINICYFFSYWNKKDLALFRILPKIFKLLLKFVCWFSHDKMIIIIWIVMKNYGDIIAHIKFQIAKTMCCTSIFSLKWQWFLTFQ